MYFVISESPAGSATVSFKGNGELAGARDFAMQLAERQPLSTHYVVLALGEASMVPRPKAEWRSL